MSSLNDLAPTCPAAETSASGKEYSGPDKAAARRFLKVLDPHTTEFTFQTFDDNQDRKSVGLVKVLNGRLDEHWDTLVGLSERGAGVFVTINTTDLKGRKAANVKCVRAVFVDTDGAPQEPIEAYDPHIIVESSPGNFHDYWLVDGCPLDDFQAAQQRMIKAWRTDQNIHDLPRVMRLPGFPHQKVSAKKGLDGTPFMVRILHVQGSGHRPDDWQSRKAIIDALDVPESSRATKEHSPQSVRAQDDWHLGPVPDYLQNSTGGKMNLMPHIDDAEDCLRYIDPRPRKVWVDVTNILATEFGEAGRELAHRWASGELWVGASK